MTKTKGLPLAIRLSAYLDNELAAGEHLEIERLIAEDEAARLLLEKLKLGSIEGNALFSILLAEPVPLSFARTIRNKQKRHVA